MSVEGKWKGEANISWRFGIYMLHFPIVSPENQQQIISFIFIL